MADLKELRYEIDRADNEIVRLFERRMRLVEDVAKYKIENGMQVLDSRREGEKLKTLSEGEKMVISFLYFIELCKGEHNAENISCYLS